MNSGVPPISDILVNMTCDLRAGRTIEEGANWIHGVENNNNPLCELARVCQLKTFDTNYYAFCARDSDAKCVVLV